MELLRYARNPWGQETLLGVSWDLLWVFFGAGALFIVAHALYAWLRTARRDPATRKRAE